MRDFNPEHMKQKATKFLIMIKCSFTGDRCILCQKEGCPWWEQMKKAEVDKKSEVKNGHRS